MRGYPGEKGEQKKPSYSEEKKPIYGKRPVRQPPKPSKPFSIEIPFLIPRMFLKPRVKRHRTHPRNRRRNDRVFNLRHPRQYKAFTVQGQRIRNSNHKKFSRLKEPIILRSNFIREPVGRNEK